MRGFIYRNIRDDRDGYRRQERPTRLERWWDGLPVWVQNCWHFLKVAFFLFLVFVIFKSIK